MRPTDAIPLAVKDNWRKIVWSNESSFEIRRLSSKQLFGTKRKKSTNLIASSQHSRAAELC